MTSSTKFKVVVDTNVFISAYLFGGNPEKVIKLVARGEVVLVLSVPIEIEIFQKLKDLKITKGKIANLKSLLDTNVLQVIPRKKVAICRDPKDDKFLEASLESHADFLITGDHDLLSLKFFKGTRILTPKEFLKAYNKSRL